MAIPPMLRGPIPAPSLWVSLPCTCLLISGYDPSETFVLDNLGTATFDGSYASGWTVTSLSDGTAQDMGGWGALTGLPANTEVTMVLDDGSATATVRFVVNATGLAVSDVCF